MKALRRIFVFLIVIDVLLLPMIAAIGPLAALPPDALAIADAASVIAFLLGIPLACALRGGRLARWSGTLLLLLAPALAFAAIAFGLAQPLGAAIGAHAGLALPLPAVAGARRLRDPGALMREAALCGAGSLAALRLVVMPLIGPALLLGAAGAYGFSLLVSLMMARVATPALALAPAALVLILLPLIAYIPRARATA